MSDPVFKSPPNFTSSDVNNVSSLVTKLNALALSIGVMTGTLGPNKGQTAWGAAIANGTGSGSTTVIGGGGGTGGTTPDLTPPPTPTGFTATAAISNIIVTCDNQTYTQGHGHLKSRLYGAIYSGTGPLPTFGSAVLIDEFTGTVESVPENPATEWHLWLTWFSNDGVEGSPAGGTNGVVATTGQDVSKLLAALTGQITESQLQAALGSRIDLIDAPSSTGGSVNARLQVELNARVTADNALQSSITTLTAQVNTNVSAISTEATTRASADAAEAIARQTVQSVLQAGAGNIVIDPAFIPGTGDWNAAIVLQLASTAGTPVGAPSQYVAKYNGHVGSQLSSQPATPGEIFDCSVWVSCASSSTNHCGLIVAAYDASNTLIGSLSPCDAGPGVTSWRQISGTYTAPALTASVQVSLWIDQTGPGPDTIYFAQPVVNRRSGSASINYAAVQTEASTRAGVDGGLLAQYTVKVDVNGYVSGFGLASTTSGATPSSVFAVRADKFYVASPSGPSISPIIPFIVVTTPTTINGVAVPVGVYMDATFIQNGTITNAKIAQLAVDDAKISSLSVTKLVAGSITVGQYIQSSSYVAGASGWRIDGNGNAEFSFAMIRGTLAAAQIAAGTVDATKIDSRGLTIKDAAGTVILGVGTGKQGGNDAATSLGFNPTWAAWANGSSYPDNWSGWSGASPTRGVSTLDGSPYECEYTITSGDVAANSRGMVRTFTFPSALPVGTAITGSYMIYINTNAGGGRPGYLIRLFTNSGLSTFVDTTVGVTDVSVSGWQRVPFTATAPGASIYGIQIYQMAGWSGMPGGMWNAGSSVAFGPLTFDFNTPIGSTQLSSSVNSDIADRLSKSVPSILSSTVSINATSGAGFVAGNLTWDGSGNRTGGSGVAMTPGGLVGFNGATKTFSIDASTGNAFFGGALRVGIASTGASSSNIGSTTTVPTGTVITSISSGTVTALTTTVGSGDVQLLCNLSVFLNCHTNTPYDITLNLLADGSSLFHSGTNPQPVIVGTLSNVTIGGSPQPWTTGENFDLSFLIPAGTLSVGSHTFSYIVQAFFLTASGTPNSISGASLTVNGQIQIREFIA